MLYIVLNDSVAVKVHLKENCVIKTVHSIQDVLSLQCQECIAEAGCPSRRTKYVNSENFINITIKLRN